MNENRIGSERIRIRISQNVLAKSLGVSNKTVSAWEQNNRRCPTEILVRLADKFGCTTDYLLAIMRWLARRLKYRIHHSSLHFSRKCMS